MDELPSLKVTVLLIFLLGGEEMFCFLFVMWSQVTTWSESRVTLWIWSPHYKSNPGTFGAQRRCGRKDISFLVCHVIKGLADIMDEFSSLIVTNLSSLVAAALVEEDIFCFYLPRDLMWPRDQRFLLHYGWVRFIISHHPPTFDAHKHCEREDVSSLVCHVILHDGVVREFPSLQATSMQTLGIINHSEEEILNFQFVMWPRMIKWLKGSVTSWESFPCHKPPSCQVWCPYVL